MDDGIAPRLPYRAPALLLVVAASLASLAAEGEPPTIDDILGAVNRRRDAHTQPDAAPAEPTRPSAPARPPPLTETRNSVDGKP